MESEKSDLIESANKTHFIASSITDKYKSREEEHRKGLEESNKLVADMETALRTANESLAKAQNEIQYLTSQVTQLETQLQQSTNDYAQLKCKYFEEEIAIEQFFAVVKKHLK
jgi:phage shock protein A